MNPIIDGADYHFTSEGNAKNSGIPMASVQFGNIFSHEAVG